MDNQGYSNNPESEDDDDEEEYEENNRSKYIFCSVPFP
jgi:hypothetical protein